jgi:hypothetical protein
VHGFASLAAHADLPELEDLKSTARENAKVSAEQQKERILSANDALQQSKDPSDFVKKMLEQREAAKAAAAKQIDETYARAIEIGKDKDVATQNLIVVGMNTVMGMLQKVQAMVSDFINSVIEKIAEFIHNLVQKVEDAFKGVFSTIAGVF